MEPVSESSDSETNSTENMEESTGSEDDLEQPSPDNNVPSTSGLNEAVAQIRDKVKENIQQAQKRQKKNYDSRVAPSEVFIDAIYELNVYINAFF